MRRCRLFNSWPTIRLIIFSLIVGCFFILFYFYPFALDDFWFLRDIYHYASDFETDENADAVVYKGHIVMPFVDGLRTTSKDGSVYVTMNGKPRVSDIVAFTGKDNKRYYLVLPLVLISDIDRTPTEVNILW